MLAQLSDLFSRETWTWIYIICFGAPIAGLATGLVLWRGKGWAWKLAFAIPFYILVAYLVMAPWSDPRIGLVVVGALLSGPLLGFTFLLPIGRTTASSATGAR